MSNYSDSSFEESNRNSSWYKVFSLVAKKSYVLDIGCSSGNFGKELIERKECKVDGIELDKSDMKLAQKILNKVWNLNIETDDISAMPTGKYDIIYFGDVVEHLVDPISALRRIKPLLSKDGRVVFSIPNMGHVGVRLALLGGKFEYTETGLLDKTHLHFYTQDEVVRVFEEAGYAITDLDFVQKDYPRKLLQKQLSKYGLTAKEDFYKKMASSNASAFQFVGAASVSKQKKHVLKQFGPIDLFEGFFEDTKKNYELELKSQKIKIKDQEKQISELQKIVKHKQDHPYRSVVGHIKTKVSTSK